MLAVSSMTTPVRVCFEFIAVILVLAINSLKMKQMIDFFGFAIVERLRVELISNYLNHFTDLGFG